MLSPLRSSDKKLVMKGYIALLLHMPFHETISLFKVQEYAVKSLQWFAFTWASVPKWQKEYHKPFVIKFAHPTIEIQSILLWTFSRMTPFWSAFNLENETLSQNCFCPPLLSDNERQLTCLVNSLHLPFLLQITSKMWIHKIKTETKPFSHRKTRSNLCNFTTLIYKISIVSTFESISTSTRAGVWWY